MTQILDYTLPEHLAARESAKHREWLTQLIAALLALVCFVGSGILLSPVNRIRKERQFVIDPATIKGLPPDISLLGKLGTFRALAIDWAAIRAERLKQEGKTYEALQLYETVCALAPRFPRVWANAAWNMAYNISVMQYTPEARWKWVRDGLMILRDKGIQYNPKAVALYKELAWIYWHKIGDFLDDEHLNYKRALAVEMERVLGAPPVTLSDQEYFDWFKKIVDAPRDLGHLLDTDADVARLVARLKTVDLAPDESLLDFIARYMRPELQVSDLLKNKQKRDALTAHRLALLNDPKEKAAVERLVAAIRSTVLREKYRFDLDWMWHLMVEEYGPLDWRNAFSHALYWVSLGDKLSQGHANLDINDQMNNARFVFFALQKLIMKGKITLWPNFDDPFSSYIELTPDTRYIPYLYDTYMRLGKKYFGDHPDFKEGTPGPIYMNGFVTSMHNWIELLYLEGGRKNREMAENFYAWLRDNNPHPDGSTQERYLKTLDEFVMGNLFDQLQTYKVAGAIIRSFVQRSLKQFSLGLSREGVASLHHARQAYDIWMLDTKHDINDRRKMQPFLILVRDQIEAYLKSPRIAPLFKVRLWKHLPLMQRQMSYDHLLSYFKRLCDAQKPAWETALAFDEPADMAAFRKTQLHYNGPARREGVDEGRKFKR